MMLIPRFPLHSSVKRCLFLSLAKLLQEAYPQKNLEGRSQPHKLMRTFAPRPVQNEIDYANRVIREVSKESDRAAVVLVGAEIDTQLKRLLEHSLSQSTEGSLPKQSRLPSSFAARIKEAYRLGLISEEGRKELNVIREIRNVFAHGLIGTSFSSPEVSELGGKLITGHEMVDNISKKTPGPKAPHNTKTLFLLSANILLAQLILTRYMASKGAAPGSPTVHITMTPKEQMDACQTALEIDPNDGYAHAELGVVLSQIGREREAIIEYQKALSIDPNIVQAQCNLGSIFIQNNQLDQGLVHLEAALKLEPDLYEINLILGHALSKKGFVARAIAHYQKALNAKPEDTATRSILGRLCYDYGSFCAQNEQIDEGILLLRKAVEINENADSHHNLGSAFALKKMFKEAMAEFEAALRLQPNDKTAKECLARLQKELSHSNASASP